METTVTSIHLNQAIQETCRLFMQIIKNAPETYVPDYDVIYQNYPDGDRIKIITYVISAAIRVFIQLPTKHTKTAFSRTVGIWRAYIVKLCQEHSADIHHLPLEIDIFAAKNKMPLDFMICHWPFCSFTLSQLLEFLSEGFHGTYNIQPPHIDEYFYKFAKQYRRSGSIKCLANSMKWLHSVKRSRSFEQTKAFLKDNVMTIAMNSEIITANYGGENQSGEIWNEICAEFKSLPEYNRYKIDPYRFFCSVWPILDDIKSYIHGLFVMSDENTDMNELLSSCRRAGDAYESASSWGGELTNLVLVSLCTVLTPALFCKGKQLPLQKQFENDFKLFVDALGELEPSVNKALILAEFAYWVNRFKRSKKGVVFANIDEYCQSVAKSNESEANFTESFAQYLVGVFTNNLELKTVPGFVNPSTIISQPKELQKLILAGLKLSLSKLTELDDYLPPITESHFKLVLEIVEKLAQHAEMTLQEHFCEKVERVIDKFNVNLLKSENKFNDDKNAIEMDDKTAILPLCDGIDYKHFVSLIWIIVNLENAFFVHPIHNLDYLNDLKYEFLTQLERTELSRDRVLARLVFFVGWRFKLRFQPVTTDELFRIHLVFRFLTDNSRDTPLITIGLKKWTLTLQSFNTTNWDEIGTHEKIIPYDPKSFYEITKLESTKNRMIQILQGQKNSSSSLKVATFPRFVRGLESTKALIQSVRLAYCRLNEASLRQKADTPRNYLLNSHHLENDLSMICSQLNADRELVLAEVKYMVSLVKNSIKDPNLLMKLEAKEYSHSKSSKDKSQKHSTKRRIKHEKETESRPYKYHKRESAYPDDYHMYKTSKYDRYDYQYDSRMRNDEMDEWYEPIQQSSIQSKLNFIEKRSSSSRLESRISYTSEPGVETICIDPGKDKARPPKFVKIDHFFDRPDINIVKKPNICQTRRKHHSTEPKSLYNFEVTRIISSGAFGKICEAYDQSTNQKVGLKRITINKSGEEGVAQSILRELLIVRALKHPNVVRFYDVVVYDLETIKSITSISEILVPKSCYFVFEYMNHDLRALMDSKSMIFSYEQIGFISKQLFSALEYIHGLNIIHRDVTPSNLLLNNKGILKLCDFGNARYLTREVNLNQQVYLTPRNVRLFYRAPEVLLEMDQYGTEVDMWACGCILYELLTSEQLFNFKAEFTMIEMVEEISRILGSPNDSVWSDVASSRFFIDLATTGIAINYIVKLNDYMEKVPHDAADVLKEIFMWDPKKRISAARCLFSPWIEGVTMQEMDEIDFPDKDYHEQASQFESMTAEQLALETTPTMTKMETTVTASENFEDDAMLSGEENEVEYEDMMNQEEELMIFVQNLSGRIIEFGEILDSFRKEPHYNPSVARGIIMHAARRWSNNEYQRIKLMEFMLNYLLRDQEKDFVKLRPIME